MFDHIDKNPVRKEITLELTDHSLSNVEAALINEVLRATGWNLKRAARRLEIARGTLYSKIKKHNISRRPTLP